MCRCIINVHFEQQEKQQFRSKVPANVRVSNAISKHLVFRLAEFNMRQEQARGDEKTKTGVEADADAAAASHLTAECKNN